MRILALGILAAGAAGLAGCGSIDEMLFGGGTEQAAQPPANPPAAQESAAPGTPASASAAPVSGSSAPAAGTPAPAPAPVTTVVPVAAPAGAEFTTVAIQPGGDTGTPVNHTIASLRAQLQGLETKLAGDAQHFADLKNTAAQASAAYQDATAHISTRLTLGTTRGNPELINEWNTAQGALDTLTGNINALSALATEVANDSSAAHQELEVTQATLNVSGAVDEDRRQLAVLSDETGQTIVVIDRLRSEVAQAVRRQTAYVANERGNLTALASAIKAGEYYAPGMSAPATMASANAAYTPGAPIATIKFDRAHVSYDRALYSALSQALAAAPGASFSIVGVSPASAPGQLAQDSAQRDAQAVMHSMGEMGVPATRMAVSSSTDPSISSSEVRVYVK